MNPIYYRICLVLLLVASSPVRAYNDLSYGIAAAQGRRPAMEDAHALRVPFITGHTNSYLFSLYDGHGTKEIADYAATHLPGALRQLCLEGTPITDALTKSILQIDTELSNSSLKKSAQHAGTTAVVCVIEENKLTVAHVGDSRAVLSRNGTALALTEDHKPDRPDEKARINATGAEVILFGVPRVGGLAVSRAMGDHALRAMGVLAEPEIASYTLGDQDEFLVLACDGIFEPSLSCQDVVDIIKKSLVQHTGDSQAAQYAAHDLVKAAYAKGSGDNLSALVVVFNKS